jgi:putative ABC transport system permease protein
MSTLAWKNLFHDKVRLIVTLTGIVFALVLIIVQFGLFLGFLETTANVVANSGADLWISAPGIPHVNAGAPLLEKRRYKALSVEGVERVDRFALNFANWKLPSGAQQNVQVAGFELKGGMGGPWNIVEGSIDALQGEDTVLIDELYKNKLGVERVGDTLEINGRRARVVGFTSGIRSFTTAPYIYTSFKNAQNYTQLSTDQTFFLLVRLKPGADPQAVKAALAGAISGVEVSTNSEMAKLTQNYWLFSTGAGVTTLLGAFLGLIVGVVVVAQTIYSATVDHIREFGTLKAMGARNSYIYRVIIEQAILSALMGYAVAIVVGIFISRSSATGEAAILLPREMIVGVLALAVFMCIAASVLSIRKATSIDPAMVFKG